MVEVAKKILVVVDDAYVRGLVIKLLQRQGFAALPAAGGRCLAGHGPAAATKR